MNRSSISSENSSILLDSSIASNQITNPVAIDLSEIIDRSGVSIQTNIPIATVQTDIPSATVLTNIPSATVLTNIPIASVQTDIPIASVQTNIPIASATRQSNLTNNDNLYNEESLLVVNYSNSMNIAVKDSYILRCITAWSCIITVLYIINLWRFCFTILFQLCGYYGAKTYDNSLLDFYKYYIIFSILSKIR